ncbi:5,6-dimethylbenzimidazole synthase [Granulicella mallensis]|uniref:Cob(II)yrinic acid a,c-diamide reductase n=1 Tax=Granulicella mallensis (strain ATCC BAA-1857 / DSM 23137 / MP5ACTX8) TaxID=682795 RepID=G8NSA4_GRAMM|nr:5,6-dimethylbenzimidazole synthase [Granulicella mallensis]AEU37398.1 cob(II)yrinic acid a,c-diamide reductase [Granulicella mallensis MP5ACTX8]
MVESLVNPEDLAFSESERAAVYRTIAARRDVRRGFIVDRPLPDELLQRLLAAAHSAPSVGLMQPSRFIVIRDLATRKEVHNIFEEANLQAAATYSGAQGEQYSALKLEGILEAPQNLCVVCDTQAARGHRLGRHTMPETAAYSTVCAIQNLWLAGRAEGVGVGWVSILDPVRLRAVLHIPEHILPVAYLCLGYVDQFASAPDLERFGWEKRVPLSTAVCYERYTEETAS